MRIWKEHIDTELIDMFLDMLFEKCGNSLYDFSKVLADFDFKLDRDDDGYRRNDCSRNCHHLQDLDEIFEKINTKNRKKILSLESKLKESMIDNKRNHELYIKQRKQYLVLKRNSVVFSMDDFDF